MVSNGSGARLRNLLDENQYVFAPGVFHALDAQIAEKVGHKAVYLSGGSLNTGLYGLPDGAIGMKELVDGAMRLTDATTLPVIADADTGFGNETHIRRAMRSYHKVGVAAVHIEDQVYPKVCGMAPGKMVVGEAEAKNRITWALDELEDTDVVLIARVDAFDADNGSWDEGIRRSRFLLDMGADLIWPEIQYHTPEEVVNFAETMHETHPDAEFLLNFGALHEWGKVENPPSFPELGNLGYSIICAPLAALYAGVYSVTNHFANLLDKEEKAQFEFETMWNESDKFGDISDAYPEIGGW
jgi:isocitrate lyase